MIKICFIKIINRILTCYSDTLTEWVALVALVADTDRNMVPYSAVGVKATQIRTRILALAVDADQVGRTC